MTAEEWMLRVERVQDFVGRREEDESVVTEYQTGFTF